MVVACERCKSDLPADAVFCRRCGRRAVLSWASPKPPDEPEEAGPPHRPAHAITGEHPSVVTAGNVFSTIAVFCGVVALLNLVVGIVGLALASFAGARREPSSRFALGVAGCGALLGIAFRMLVFDGGS